MNRPRSHKGVLEGENPAKTPFSFRKIVVVGATGSGKTTLAAALARCLSIVHIELDALHWDEGWKEAPDEIFLARVSEALRAPAWVADGNYRAARELVWSRAEAILWLDYPLPVNFWRLFSRTIRRSWTREIIWNGNVESFWIQWKLWSEDSLFHWFFKTYWKRKREYAALFKDPAYAHLAKLRFPSPAETDQWMRRFCHLDPSRPSR